MIKVGFIGLGIMGKPMATHIIRGGFETYVLDLDQAAVTEMEKIGGYPCHTLKEIAEQADVIITMLPSAKHVSQVLFDAGGIVDHAQSTKLVIDMSSVSPQDAIDMSNKLNEYGIASMDAPVSGGEPMAVSGQLSIMVGGCEKDFQKALPILQTMGGNVVHVGEIGAGSAVKLANQIIVNVTIAALSEAILLASKLGVDLNKMHEAIRNGLAGSAVMESKMPKMVARDFMPGGRIDINFKDLTNIMASANASGVSLPITSQVKEIFHSEMLNGNGDKDHSFILNHFEKLANFQVSKKGEI